MRVLPYLRDTAVFAPCYLLLDWVSYIDPLGPFNITPWNPQPALAVVWMMLGGIAHSPAVLATILVADALVRDVPAGLAVSLAAAVALTAGYAGLAWGLRRLLRPNPTLHSLRQLTAFVCVVVPGTAIVAAAFVGVLSIAGQLELRAAVSGWLRFWVGDAVGVLVTAPLLLVVADAESRRRFLAIAARSEIYLQVLLVAAALWLIFSALGGDPSHHVYLLFLPLIWIAVRSGMVGAIVALAIIQLGVVLGIHGKSAQTFPILELQALVAGLTLTGLYLGVMLDERERAAEGLKQSLRLAAAGEMAGAIAHEVNQPLTALTNYGRAGQHLFAAGRTAEIAPILEKILAEAQRAAEVVRRLRDFFREGTTRLERTAVAELLATARRVGSNLGPSRVSFAFQSEPDLPDVLVDRLQLELVLRNLLANAVEAIDAQPSHEARVTVSARRHDAKHLAVVVSDSGPGLLGAAGERVFEPFVSGKPSGMGLGLTVSRAIAEAHGGALNARSGPHGEFCLVLPFEAPGG
jgi:two-component system sensor kinase FixL